MTKLTVIATNDTGTKGSCAQNLLSYGESAENPQALCPRTSMDPMSLSYAQSLRAIGQSLELLRIDSFELHKKGANYIAYLESSKPARAQSSGRRLLKRIVEVVWRPGSSNEKIFEPRLYTPSDISWLDSQGLARRGNRNAIPNLHKRSQVLRVIGDYLDQREAQTFTVSWASQSVSVYYETWDHRKRGQDFTVEELYNLGAEMFRRRSSRRQRL